MRAVVLLVALVAACGPGASTECVTDGDCGNDVCARDGECLPAADVTAVKVTWTIRGMPASTTTCAQTPDFFIYFQSPSDRFGFAPVPCNQGSFFVDKLPKRYTQVEIGADGRFDDFTIIDPQTGTAKFDLFP